MINHKRGFHHNCSVLLRSRSVSSMSQLTARPAAVMSREKRRAEVGEGGDGYISPKQTLAEHSTC